MFTISSYTEGYEAFNRGKQITENPYPGMPKEYDDWNDGWLDARDEVNHNIQQEKEY